MQTAFVTGGTGFLGRHIIEQLSSAGVRVTALRRATSNVRHLEKYAGVALAEGTINDRESLVRAIPEGCDAVFHVAGNTSFWSGGDAQQTRDNVDGTRNVVDAAITRGAKRFVHTSSVAAWGEQHQIPFDETATSKALSSPINYERSKYLGELEVDHGIARGLEAVIINPGHVMGRYDTTGWARMITLVNRGKLPGIPPGSGSFADATEVARAHITAVEKGGVGERYLLGGADATYVELVGHIGRLLGKKVPAKAMPAWIIRAIGRASQWGSYATRRAPDVSPEIATAMSRPPHYFRSDKAIRELGYRAVPLAEMVRESHAWMKDEGLL